MRKTLLICTLILSAFSFSGFAQDVENNVSNEGRVFWRGTVDDAVRIEIQGSDLTVQTVSGKDYGEGTFSFTTPMPNDAVLVGVNKKSGRGLIAVIQKPDESNHFTAVIEIRDTKAGAKEYQLEIYWR